VVFTFWLAWAHTQKQRISCGCFGGDHPISPWAIIRNILLITLAATSIWLLWRQHFILSLVQEGKLFMLTALLISVATLILRQPRPSNSKWHTTRLTISRSRRGFLRNVLGSTVAVTAALVGIKLTNASEPCGPCDCNKKTVITSNPPCSKCDSICLACPRTEHCGVVVQYTQTKECCDDPPGRVCYTFSGQLIKVCC
jgi:hypothetical protein